MVLEAQATFEHANAAISHHQSMINDSGMRTVKIAVRIVDGALCPFYGKSWPKLRDGAIGEVTFPAHAFREASDVALLTSRLGIPFIRSGEKLLVAINNDTDKEGIVREGNQFISATRHFSFVEIITDGELRLDLRGTKRATLASCRCKIPALNKTADSVNEAYKIVSEAFEPERRSHAGNVFLKVFYHCGDHDGKPYWAPLDDLRMQKEAILESRFGKPTVSTGEQK